MNCLVSLCWILFLIMFLSGESISLSLVWILIVVVVMVIEFFMLEWEKCRVLLFYWLFMLNFLCM